MKPIVIQATLVMVVMVVVASDARAQRAAVGARTRCRGGRTGRCGGPSQQAAPR